MKLSLVGTMCAAGLMWSGAILLVGVINMAFPSYGMAFLEVISSVYPGYDHGTGGLGEVLVGAGYALIDGALAGLIFALLHNLFAGLVARKA